MSVDSVNNSPNAVQRSYENSGNSGAGAVQSASNAAQSGGSEATSAISSSSSSDDVNFSARAENTRRSRVVSLDDEQEYSGETDANASEDADQDSSAYIYYEDGAKRAGKSKSGPVTSTDKYGNTAGAAHSEEADDLADYIVGEFEQQGWQNFSADDVIRVCGTEGDDVINISMRSMDTLDIEINGEKVTYKGGDLKKLLVDAGKGDDLITIDPKYMPDFYMKGLHIAGGEGSDTIKGGSGSDVIFDYYGASDIDGGDGNDMIIASGRSKDGSQVYDSVLRGGKGDDYLEGGLGNDQLDGGVGDDVLYGLSGDDQLIGGQGADYLDGGLGSDVLQGDAGRDTLVGGKDNDTLFGGADADLLIGASGTDTMDGGADTDRIFMDGAHDIVNDAADDRVETLSVASLPKNYVINGDEIQRERLESDLEFLASTENGQLMFSEVGKTKHTVELNTTFGRSLNRTNQYSEDRKRGADSSVYINRSKVSLEQGYAWDHCPPVVALYHEMVHSYNAAIGNMDHNYYNAKGKQVNSSSGTRAVEYQAVGIANPAVEANDPRLTENGMRDFLGLKQRLKY